MAQSHGNAEELQRSNSLLPLSTRTFLPNDNNIQVTIISSSDHIIPSLSRHEASSSSSIVAASLQGETDTVVNGHEKNNKSYFNPLHLINKKAKQMNGRNVKLQRSTSLPLRTGDPSIANVDNKNIEVITKSLHHTSSLSRHGQQTPGEAYSAPASVHGETATWVNQTALQVDLGSLKRLYEYALQDNWEGAKSIYERFPDMVRIPLTASGDTTLHVAVNANRTKFVEELVKLEFMTLEDLEIRNADGNTAFCMAAILGKSDCFQIMTQKNPNMPLFRGHNDMLPVHFAAFIGHHNIVKHLVSDNDLLEKIAPADIQRLFLLTIGSNMYGVATDLFEKYPYISATARDHYPEGPTALHMLARKPSEEYGMHEDNIKESSGRDHQLQLLKMLWSEVRQLEHQEILDLVTKPSAVLFDAVKLGNEDVVKWLLYMNPKLLKIKDPTNGQNLLHLAALYRRKIIFDFILKMKTANLLIPEVDNDHNNVLHFAASHQLDEASTSSKPNIQMQIELVWFKKVQKKVPQQLRTMINNQGKTPNDIFYAAHSKLSNEVKDSARGIANSGMIVAVLIVAVAFAAVLTVPGDKTNNWFIVFILANAVALFTSSMSIISFLTIFTSSKFSESEYIIFLHPSVKVGLLLVLTSIGAMIVAFVAASFLIFEHRSKWVAYTVASLGILPIELLTNDQFGFSPSKDIFDHVYLLSKAHWRGRSRKASTI